MEDFDKIYTEYFPLVYKFVLSLCRNPSLAEEITQETFFKALKNADRFNRKCKMTTWLCKIAKNAYFDYCKKHKKNRSSLGFLPAEEDMEARFADKETAYAIHKALHTLNEPYREVFWLRAFGEMPFLQIAALFEKTEGWARVTYYRAKLLIKEELQ